MKKQVTLAYLRKKNASKLVLDFFEKNFNTKISIKRLWEVINQIPDEKEQLALTLLLLSIDLDMYSASVTAGAKVSSLQSSQYAGVLLCVAIARKDDEFIQVLVRDGDQYKDAWHASYSILDPVSFPKPVFAYLKQIQEIEDMPMIYAAFANNIPLLEMIIDAGYGAGLKTPQCIGNTLGRNRKSSFYYLFNKYHALNIIEVLPRIIGQSGDIQILRHVLRCIQQYYPEVLLKYIGQVLGQAAEYGHLKMVQFLLSVLKQDEFLKTYAGSKEYLMRSVILEVFFKVSSKAPYDVSKKARKRTVRYLLGYIPSRTKQGDPNKFAHGFWIALLECAIERNNMQVLKACARQGVITYEIIKDDNDMEDAFEEASGKTKRFIRKHILR